MCCSNSIDGYYRLFDPLNLTQSVPLIAGGAFKAYDYRSFYWSGRSTSVLSTDDDAYLSESLQLSPNPASTDLNLTVDLPQPAPVSLRFFTATGRLMSEMPAVQRPAGAFNSTFDVANWPNGVYFCQINIGRTNIARKIIIAR
jgi:Secretion system C-terminal sorting domain